MRSFAFSLLFSHDCTDDFSMAMICDINRSKAEAERWIKLSSIKPDINHIYKNINNTYF